MSTDRRFRARLPEWVPDGDAERAALLGVGALALAALLLVTPLTATLPGSLLVFVEVAVVFLLYTQLVLGLNLQYGHTGLVNFGHVAFFAVGAYAVAMLSAEDPFAGVGLGLPWPLGLAAGVAVATVLGLIVGATSLRLRDDFLAIATLATAEILHELFVTFRGVFGGNVGILGVPQPVSALADSSDTGALASLLAFAGLSALAFAVVHRLTEAPYGRVLRAIRADELVTRSLGKPTLRYKMESFVYGAALAGFAGGLYALYNGAVAPGFFTLNVTVIVWIGMLLGGAGEDRAVVAGLAIIMGLRLATRFLHDALPVSSGDFAALRLMIVGLVLVVVVRYRPEGIWGDPHKLEVDDS